MSSCDVHAFRHCLHSDFLLDMMSLPPPMMALLLTNSTFLLFRPLLLLCKELVQPDGHTAILPVKWHRGLPIPVCGREVDVVCGGEEQNDEEASGTPRSVL